MPVWLREYYYSEFNRNYQKMYEPKKNVPSKGKDSGLIHKPPTVKK